MGKLDFFFSSSMRQSIFILHINISIKSKAREMACQVCTPFIKSAGDAVHLAASNPVIREAAQGVEKQCFPLPVENPCLPPKKYPGEELFLFFF